MFGYCIWLIPDKTSELYNKTNGFIPHISLGTHFTEDEAKEYFKTIDKKTMNLSILTENEYNEYNGFYSYYHMVKHKELDSSSHISLLYSREPILQKNRDKAYNSIDFTKQYRFSVYKIVCCEDKDFHKWYIVE